MRDSIVSCLEHAAGTLACKIEAGHRYIGIGGDRTPIDPEDLSP